MRGLSILLFLMVSQLVGMGQQVIQVRWPTKQAAPPVAFNGIQSDWLPAFHLALTTVPEETLVAMSLYQGHMLGLSTNEAQSLQLLFANQYARLRQVNEFKKAPSALPHCFSEHKPTNGVATVYIPANPKTDTPTIVFLHGYGGSFLAYLHYLKTIFPDQLIICPAYGISCANISGAYITEARNAVATQVPAATNKPPLLIGLSAGGVGACRVYGKNPELYRRLIAIAAMPPADAVNQFSAKSDARFIVGGVEPYVKNGAFGKVMQELKPTVRAVEWKVVDGADHYFLFSREEETKKALKDWAGK